MTPFLDPVVLFIPGFLLSLLLEYKLIPKAKYDLKDAGLSISMGLGNLATTFLFGGLIWWATLQTYQHRIFNFEMSWLAIVALVLTEDFVYYWFHRLSHEVRFWWAAHVNHHSSQHYNLSTALRQNWTGNFVFTWALWLPLSWLGFDPRYILLQKSISLLYQYWIHTELINRMPNWFEWIFNTPSHHRVHHASNVQYLDANYAGIFIIWDRLLGTFVAEDEAEKVRYGLTKNIQTQNLLVIAFHEWMDIFADLKDPKKRKYAFGYLFGPPGYSHDGSRKTAKQMQAELKKASN